MTYPNKFEEKIGFDEVRILLKQFCLSSLGKQIVDNLQFTSDCNELNLRFTHTREFRLLQEKSENFPLQYFFDVRESVVRIKIEGTYMDENEVFDLRRSLDTIAAIVAFLNRGEQNGENLTFYYPALQKLTEDVKTFPNIVARIDAILDKFGRMKDNASPRLAEIRSELSKAEKNVSNTLTRILHSAQKDGIIDKDTAPTVRDGRLMIPVAPSQKRKISGVMHSESATGKTIFIEPTEVVEANNRIRELENDERQEIIRILMEFTTLLRPHADEIVQSYEFLALIDFIRAKAELAKHFKACEPQVSKNPVVDWKKARHPLLEISLKKQKKNIVPLDIKLSQEQRILIISGPNAGGKSVCLKTVGLLQYMLQCGISIPLGEGSTTGVFKHVMIDIGDEQSIENDLSTYSSHLTNMKQMMKMANNQTLLLIDEFGTGTEPTIGGAIAESVLKQFWDKKAFGIITTHYQNLKLFADEHESVVNGAMLYDRKEMQALFQLEIGRPGSSFAIEIARKIGIPEEVINDATQIVGSEYIQSDKYLQDIVRDKRYWENKRQNVHQREKELERTILRYEDALNEIEKNRKDILKKAKEQAEEVLRESNKKIENTIREIRESQAEKAEIKRIREELDAFKIDIQGIDKQVEDERIAKKIKQIQERKERQEKRKKEKLEPKTTTSKHTETNVYEKGHGIAFKKDDSVKIIGLSTVGTIETIDGNMATVIFGDMRTKMRVERLEKAEKTENQAPRTLNRMTRETIDKRREHFHQDIDVRGMRGDEAILQVQYFIDDAILVGMPRVRILHGKGNGILRQLIRQYLSTVPNVTAYKDEHVQFGGAGITVVDLE